MNPYPTMIVIAVAVVGITACVAIIVGVYTLLGKLPLRRLFVSPLSYAAFRVGVILLVLSYRSGDVMLTGLGLQGLLSGPGEVVAHLIWGYQIGQGIDSIQIPVAMANWALAINLILLPLPILLADRIGLRRSKRWLGTTWKQSLGRMIVGGGIFLAVWVPAIVVIGQMSRLSPVSLYGGTRDQAMLGMAYVIQDLQLYRLQVGRYPSPNEGLRILLEGSGESNWKGPFIDRTHLVDPWGTPYSYDVRDEVVHLKSAGRDRAFGTDDDLDDWSSRVKRRGGG